MIMQRTLIIFARQPIPGATKTRLCPPLDPLTAAALYACFLQDVLEQASRLPGVRPVIAYTPATAGAFFTHLAPSIPADPQVGDALGERMNHALTHWLGQLGEKGIAPSTVALIGSDSPNLPASYLSTAFEQLEAGAEVVLGPADDGGYYLIGMRRPQPRLLREVTMSTPTVLADTLAIAAQQGIDARLLPCWYDIDTADDLRRLSADLHEASPDIAPRTRAFLKQLTMIES